MEGWRDPPLDFATIAIAATSDNSQFGGSNALVVPIVCSSVFVSHHPASEPHDNSAYHYGRCGNPTRSVFEKTMAYMDGTKHALAFSSGVAAITAVSLAFPSGSHALYVQCSNGDADWLFRNKWPTLGFDVEFVYSNDPATIASKVNPRTKIVWMESPANPTMALIDLEEVSMRVHASSQAIVVVDNTFLTPVFQRPIDLGADVAVYSCTKYLCGHADVTMGLVTLNDDALFKKIQENQICMGGIPSPFDCFLMIRSLKTLPLRMKSHFSNGLAVGVFLEGHPNVLKVLHPGLSSHSQYGLAKKQQFGHSGMLSFLIKGGLPEAAAFLDALKIFRKAPSLGSDVSIASIPSKASHSWLPESERERLGISDNLIRLSVGLESSESLIADLRQALCAAPP